MLDTEPGAAEDSGATRKEQHVRVTVSQILYTASAGEVTRKSIPFQTEVGSSSTEQYKSGPRFCFNQRVGYTDLTFYTQLVG